MSMKLVGRAAALAAASLLATARPAPTQVPVGTVLHYVKTNLDGSRPEQIALYVSGVDRIEVYKYHPGETPAGLVAAQFDWARSSLTGLRSIQRRSATESREVASFDYDPATRTGRVLFGGPEMPVRFTHSPFGVYAFELADLNMLLARTAPEAYPTDLMLVDLSYGDPNPTLYERGRVLIRGDGEETRGAARTRRYRLTGAGTGEQVMTLWVDREHGWITEIESPIPNHPAWNSYRLRLERVEVMTPVQWTAFQVAAIQGGD
jgi:hypothetical protein